ncbi:MAG TPA: hypothetical protein PLS27_04445 [Treponemataceae bacterium]|jgi:hypothetical protein|nr:hypothetical protein [Treponemataceae bacterium]HPX13589.1 hypothetical protein [Treponemataceae bacterium]
MYSNKLSFFLVFFLIVLVLSGVPEEKTMLLGGPAGWTAFSREQNLARARGRLGYEAVVLDSSGDSATDDLYLSFDGTVFGDEAENYALVSNDLLPAGTAQARHGGAALCNTDNSGLVLRGSPESLFGSPGAAKSFTIEFWLYPAVTENGSILFQWRSSRTGDGLPRYQYIRSVIMKNRLEWSFSNIWSTFAGEPVNVVLSGRRNLVPGEWTHHALSYDAVTGLLEYRIDGETEVIRFLTHGGRESGDVYPAILGAVSEIEIAPRFSGLLDEFRIRRSPAGSVTIENRNELMNRYPVRGGRFETNPLDSGGPASVLESLDAEIDRPGETGAAFFVRAGENFYRWTDTSPEWQPVRPGEPVTGVSGRYFQVAVELYPDGEAAATPVLTSISLKYREDTPPWPPVRLRAEPGDGFVTLSWPASIDHDTAGYLVYWGTRPGEYLGSGSPLDAGKNLSAKIENLENGVLYYFSVAAYDAAGKTHQGPQSAEASVRPLAVYGSGGN